MKFYTGTLLALVAVVSARHISLEDVIELEKTPRYGYIKNIGIPLANKIRIAEEQGTVYQGRIIDGSYASLGQFPYQAGLVLELPHMQAFAGGVLVSPNRIFTAGHNLMSAEVSVTRITVVLGSVTIFTGGTRIVTSDFIIHENYDFMKIVNDVGMINLPTLVETSNIIAPIALPSGSQLDETFAGEVAIASGFGRTADIGGVVADQRLSYVPLTVIKNEECAQFYSGHITSSNVCTQSEGRKNICTGDSGGPLAITRNNEPLLVCMTFELRDYTFVLDYRPTGLQEKINRECTCICENT